MTDKIRGNRGSDRDIRGQRLGGNVAPAYARAADALRGNGSFDVDFNLAVQRHKLVDAIEQSSPTGQSVRVDQT